MAEAPVNRRPITIRINASEAGQRLDRVLVARLRLPRNQIQQWIRAGNVRVEGKPVKASHPVVRGETVVAEPLPRDLQGDLEPEVGDLVVLYEDQDLVVIDKPAGLVVHPGAGRTRGTLAHRLLARFPEIAQVGGTRRPGIVHRLDKDTTGVLVIARSASAYQSLAADFAERRVEKRYLALVYGVTQQREGRIAEPIARHPQRRQEMRVHPKGRPALTGYHRVASAAGISLLELDLATGRTHQIRVHLKSLRHPLIGDPTYGEARWKDLPRPVQQALRSFPRPALHAWRLRVVHPGRDQAMDFEAPPPEDLKTLWQQVTGADWPLLGAAPG